MCMFVFDIGIGVIRKIRFFFWYAVFILTTTTKITVH